MNKIDTNAKSALNDYFTILTNFTKIQTKAQTYSSFLFSLLGYRTDNYIKNTNFYHYASEAYIISLFQELKEEIQKDVLETLHSNENPIEVKYSYNDLINKILNIEINENTFMKDLEFLLGTETFNEPIVKVTQLKLAQLFLKKVRQAKKELLSKKIHPNLTRKEFEELLSSILRRGLNYTLNELDPKEENKYSVILSDSFVANENKEKPTLGFFINEVNKRRNIIPENREVSKTDIEIINPNYVFYNYAMTDFSDLLKDITTFVSNSESIIQMIRQIIKLAYSKMIDMYAIIRGFALSAFEVARNLNVIKYLEYVFEMIKKRFSMGMEVACRNKEQLKEWISTSKIGETSGKYFENLKFFIQSNVYDKLIAPSQGIVSYYYQNSYKFTVDTYGWTKTQINQFINMLSERIQMLLKKVNEKKELVFGQNPLFKIINDGSKYIDIEINKNLNLLNNETVSKFASEVINQIKEMKNLSLFDIAMSVSSLPVLSKGMLIKTFMNILAADDSTNAYNKQK